jgi:hypothetical protein
MIRDPTFAIPNICHPELFVIPNRRLSPMRNLLLSANIGSLAR